MIRQSVQKHTYTGIIRLLGDSTNQDFSLMTEVVSKSNNNKLYEMSGITFRSQTMYRKSVDSHPSDLLISDSLNSKAGIQHA